MSHGVLCIFCLEEELGLVLKFGAAEHAQKAADLLVCSLNLPIEFRVVTRSYVDINS